jgi:8-oxo-dGTP pyrophosphatase MutT (NUDIX family)
VVASGGFADPLDTPSEAVVREVREETGYIAEVMKLVGWFGIEDLPELSAGRVNRWELERVLAHHRDPSLPTEFD